MSLSDKPHCILEAAELPCSVQKWFSRHHWHWKNQHLVVE